MMYMVILLCLIEVINIFISKIQLKYKTTLTLYTEKTLYIHNLKKATFLGTLYSPTDGTIDPTGICTATTRAAKKAGAKV